MPPDASIVGSVTYIKPKYRSRILLASSPNRLSYPQLFTFSSVVIALLQHRVNRYYYPHHATSRAPILCARPSPKLAAPKSKRSGLVQHPFRLSHI